jgi:rhodanese-related sulfurtransferase
MTSNNHFLWGLILGTAIWGSVQAGTVDAQDPVAGGWENAGVAVPVTGKQVAAELEHFYLLDLRPGQTHRQLHLRGAVPVETSELPRSRHLLPVDTDTPVLVYDQDGSEVRQAARVLGMMGYQQVYVLEGGIDDWQQKSLMSGLALERGSD